MRTAARRSATSGARNRPPRSTAVSAPRVPASRLMAAPVPFRVDPDKAMPSYPPVVYYRDTYGLENGYPDLKHSDSLTTECSDDSATTKSTVRGLNMHAVNPMYASNTSKNTNMSQSYQQVVTDRVLFKHPRTLLALSLIMFASAVQLLIFSIICAFYDGCPYYIVPVVSGVLLVNTMFVFLLQKFWPTRPMLYISSVAAALSFVESVALFFYCAYLINQEDKYIDQVGSRPNRIVTSTRIATYSLHMTFSPIHGIVSLICAILLCQTMKEIGEDGITKAYFMSEPQIGHQRILVPIELRQVRDMDEDSLENASVAVQTSSTRTHVV